MKAFRTHTPPPIIEFLCPATSHYNFSVIEDETIPENEGEAYISYEYDQVTVQNPVTRQGIKNAISEQGYDLETLENIIDRDCDNLGIE
jgi:hypothetical protein